MKKDIKELEEFLDGLMIIAAAAGAVMQDGKIDFKDTGVMVILAPRFETLVEAFEGLGEIKEEIKDLKEDEVLKVVTKLYAIANAFAEAKKA